MKATNFILRRGEKTTYSMGRMLDGSTRYVLLAYRYRLGAIKSRVLGEFLSFNALKNAEKQLYY